MNRFFFSFLKAVMLVFFSGNVICDLNTSTNSGFYLTTLVLNTCDTEKGMQSQVACGWCCIPAVSVDIWIRNDAFKCFRFPVEG